VAAAIRQDSKFRAKGYVLRRAASSSSSAGTGVAPISGVLVPHLLCHRHDGRQFDDWMRGTPHQAAEMMKPYTGAIEAWEVQLTGHALLRARGIELVPVDGPTYFTDPSPTAEIVRQSWAP